MSLRDLIKKNKMLFSLAFLYRNLVISFLNRKKTVLNQSESEILKTLKKDGIVVIPNYFSDEQCEILKAEYDQFVSKHSFFCEENERRIFGMDKLSPEVKKIFSDDELSNRICEAYLGEEIFLQSTMSARIDYVQGVQYGSGGSWHRDSFSRQVKSIAYLTDMTDDNGPFMYIKGSHKLWSILKVLFSLKRAHKAANYQRYSDDDILKIQDILGSEVSYFPCKKGTLVLSDIRGLHTTRFLKQGFAYSIFNYYIAKKDHNPKGFIKEVERKCLSGEYEGQV